MLEEGYSPGQDSSSVSSDESQAEPTIQTGGGFGKGPTHSHRKAVCYLTQTSPSLCTPTSVCFNSQWDAYPSKFLAFFIVYLRLAACAADPALTLASDKTVEFSGDVMVRSRAPGRPNSQLGTKISAGRVRCPSCPRPQPASILGLSHAR